MQVQFAQQRYCEIFDTANTSGCEDVPAAEFNGTSFALVRVPSAPAVVEEGGGAGTSSNIDVNTVELFLPDAAPATPQIVTGDVVLFVSGDGSGRGRGTATGFV
jgi:hypothetical protein